MRKTLVVLASSLLVLAACASREPSATPLTAAAFVVDEVEVQVEGEGPADVTLTVRGHFPDACTTLGEVTQTRSGNAVSVDLPAVRPSAAACAQAITPHTETVRLGTFDEPGDYLLRVNTFSTAFTIGSATAGAAGYAAELVVPLQTPDGTIALLAPLGWAVEVNPGIIRIADDASTLSAPGPVIQGSSLTVIVATGPGRARDFGLDGRTLNEVYAYFVATSGVRTGPPRPLSDSPFAGLGGHQSDPDIGDAELRVLSLDDATSLVLIAASPPGEWNQFSPLFEAMAASLRLP